MKSKEVLPLLAYNLECAKKERFDIGLVIMVRHDHPQNACTFNFNGHVSLQPSLLEALDVARQNLQEAIDQWKLPLPDPNLDASYVCYNVASCAISFDFVVWLMDAEMTRIREGAPGPLKVAFYRGKNPEDFMGKENRQIFLDKVFRPALKLIGAVEDERALYGRHKMLYVTRDIVGYVNAGEKIPYLKSPLKSPFPGYVTITLREAAHTPDRNSNMTSWRKFARYLRERGEKVLFIRDTCNADFPLDDFATCPEASRNLLMRMAVYQEAKINLFVSNGPASLALFSSAPWMTFNRMEEDDDYQPNTAEFWTKGHGIERGSQFPWCRPDQRIVWKMDTFENLVEAWSALPEYRAVA